MKREIKVGSISWISGKVNPMWTAAQAAVLTPDWVPKTYLGLAATANNDPPSAIADFKQYQGKKDFRALTYCHIIVDIDDKTSQINGFEVKDAVHDPGWTPPFSMAKFPSTALSFDTSIYSNQSYQGEASPVSVVNTQARHKNTVIKSVPATETVLVNALIKFRAGKHTDDIGVKNVGAPFHVPWVWCETVVTYASGAIKLYGQGSIFPSHAWYLNGTQVKKVSEVGDAAFPLAAACLSAPTFGNPFAPKICLPTNTINYTSLKLYAVLKVGAPAAGPQTDLKTETGKTGAVDSHANTASGGTVVTYP